MLSDYTKCLQLIFTISRLAKFAKTSLRVPHLEDTCINIINLCLRDICDITLNTPQLEDTLLLNSGLCFKEYYEIIFLLLSNEFLILAILIGSWIYLLILKVLFGWIMILNNLLENVFHSKSSLTVITNIKHCLHQKFFHSAKSDAESEVDC